MTIFFQSWLIILLVNEIESLTGIVQYHLFLNKK